VQLSSDAQYAAAMLTGSSEEFNVVVSNMRTAYLSTG